MPRSRDQAANGRGGNVAEGATTLLAFAARGFDVLAYDYRGYGRSEGRPTEEGLYLDAEAAFDTEAARGFPPAHIVCFGESLGGAVSIHLAVRRPCGAVVVVSTFTSLRDVAIAHYTPLASLVVDGFDSSALVGRLRVPFFEAHGDRDDVVPYALGERLFTEASEPKGFFRISGAGHDDVFENPSLVDQITRFVHVHRPA